MDAHSSEPSPLPFNDPSAPLAAKVKELKAKLEEVNKNFSYYETSNEKLEKKVEEQQLDIKAKNFELLRLRDRVRNHEKEHEETQLENVKLRRQSSTFEKIVEARDKEIKGIANLELTIEDREAEVRQFTADLTTTKAERDDQITEVKGLEGDIAILQQELETKDREIESLLERLDIVARHITVTKDLAAEELDDVLFEFMDKWTATRDDDGPRRPEKPKRASIGGINLADEFEALSDDEFWSEDGGDASDAASIRSHASEQTPKKTKPTLGLSGVKSIAIHPSIKATPNNISGSNQTSPIPSPKKPETTSTQMQTSSIASPKKKSLSQIVSHEVQTSPIAALIQKFTFSDVRSGVNTSPVAASPKTSFSEIISSGVQTSPISPSAKKAETLSEMIISGLQTSPIAASSNKPTSPRKTFAEVLSSGVQTSPIAPFKKNAASDTTNAGTQTSPPVKSPSGAPLPANLTATSSGTSHSSNPAVKSPTSTKSPKSPLSNEITSDQIALDKTRPPQHGKLPRINTLNIKRPRVPAKDMSPRTLQHFKSITNPDPSSPLTPPPGTKVHVFDLLSNTATPIAKSFVATALANWQIILCCFFTVFAGSYLGSATANTAAEWSWANANGYAPEGKYVYVGKRVPGHVLVMFWGVIAWCWNLVFGSWFVGAGARQPLSPG
ncbi:hypothetical protein M436DRAFT_57564 [Aureobasidium namibiae CBS 147.97]|uniref:Uncharacterized protein n=1 Tax=Aureobasidium namibiae CBS 147.97 TaxID=1043004 RepID=A0A074W6Y5_9PEZI|nr:uncharacterized protein M436DRAFT_57564 [Aureobasidium namibiae CBS 147.97]KEQ68895.1 hypothetical protein M436DRAFT_57564 [Aureobasidium namibiae CBS 147.97]